MFFPTANEERGLRLNSFEDIVDDLNKLDEKETSRLAKLAAMQLRAEARVESLEVELKQAKDELKRLQEQDVPALMAELGMAKFTLENGAEVVVKPYYSASINKDDPDSAFEWLVKGGFGDLIKNTVSTNFVLGQEQEASKFLQECEDRGLNASTKKWVEPMTLKAFVKEQFEKGNPLPQELFNVFVGQKATIKKEKS